MRREAIPKTDFKVQNRFSVRIGDFSRRRNSCSGDFSRRRNSCSGDFSRRCMAFCPATLVAFVGD